MVHFLKEKFLVPIYDLFLRLFDVRWRYYLIRKCESAGVIFEDKYSVMFNGRCWLNLSKKGHFKIGRNVTINSGPKYCINAIPYSKIEVYDGASLVIGGQRYEQCFYCMYKCNYNW